jgi:hypothetical protein
MDSILSIAPKLSSAEEALEASPVADDLVRAPRLTQPATAPLPPRAAEALGRAQKSEVEAGLAMRMGRLDSYKRHRARARKAWAAFREALTKEKEKS